VRERVPDGAVDLRETANRVGVLHAVAVPVALDDFGPFGEALDVARARRLAVVGPHALDVRVAVRRRRQRDLRGERARGVRRAERPLGVEEGERRQGRR